MRYLTDRFSGLKDFRPLSLVEAPTKIQGAAAISEAARVSVWVKRDDLTHTDHGGNKVRKLEWLLREAETNRVTDIVTTGGIGSHHVLATALFAKPLGIRVHGVLVPQPNNAYVRLQLARIKEACATHRVAQGEVLAGLEMGRRMLSLRAKGRRVAFMGPGGSSAVGIAGFVDAGLELAAQVREGMPEPEAVYVPLGSGGTAVGLALGLSLTELDTQVVAVRVAHRIATHPRALRYLTNSANHFLQRWDPSVPNRVEDTLRRLRVLQSFGGPAYGATTPAGVQAAEIGNADGLALDPTYTAKSAAALLAHAKARFRTVLLWQTAPQPVAV